VASRKQTSSSQAPKQHGDWLRRGQTARVKPWALEVQLFGRKLAMGQNRQLDALADRLSEEQLALSRMEAELHAQASRVAELEHELEVEIVAGPSDDFPAGQPKAQASHDAPRRTVALRPSHATLDRNYWLCRCEGFLVESPTGMVGVVVGFRFGSRIDRPDLLEVEAGHFRAKLLLIPVEDVSDIAADEERVVLGCDPPRHSDLVHELLLRVRDKITVSPS
jgi:hypothetical protein